MINIYTIKSKVEFKSEQVILFGLGDDLLKIEDNVSNRNFNNVSRYGNAIEVCNQTYKYVDDIKDADVLVLPHKFYGLQDPVLIMLHKLGVALGKKLFCFFNDDIDYRFDLSNFPNLYLFRTSFYKSKKFPNEYGFPGISPDFFDGTYLNKDDISIGYRGNNLNGRQYYLNLFDKSKFKTNFEISNGYFGESNDTKKDLRRVYVENLKRNMFTYCYRGTGNWSYRLYDVFMMGRIPILVNTDCVYPFEEFYNIRDHCVFVEDEDVKSGKVNLEEEIQKFCDTYDLEEVQKKNRELYETYFKAEGIIKSMIKYI